MQRGRYVNSFGKFQGTEGMLRNEGINTTNTTDNKNETKAVTSCTMYQG